MVKDTFYIFRTELCIILCLYVQKGIILVFPKTRGGGGEGSISKEYPGPTTPSKCVVHPQTLF